MGSLLAFFFNDTATTEIYTLSLHDALPIYQGLQGEGHRHIELQHLLTRCEDPPDAAQVLLGSGRAGHRLDVSADLLVDQRTDRKSTRLNSSHANISYAVFCLKKKNKATSRC